MDVVQRLIYTYDAEVTRKTLESKTRVDQIVYRLLKYYDVDYIRYKSYLAAAALIRNFQRLDRVAVAGCMNPIAIATMLKSEFGSTVTLVSDHASLEKSVDFYEDIGVDALLKNPFYDAIDFSGFDAVVFPDFEYSVPLQLMKRVRFSDAAVACFHHKNSFIDQSNAFEIYDEEDLLDLCCFKEVIDSGREKNIDRRPYHYAIGRLPSAPDQ